MPLRVLALIAALSVAVLSYTLNASMLSALLPDIARALSASDQDIAQVSSLFFLSGSVAGIVLTRWSDFIGRRRMLLSALGVTVCGTVICMLAPTLPLLLCGRVLQGAASTAFQLTYLILVETLSAAQFSVALGVITAVNGGFGGIDGALGGLIARRFGYQAVFGCILAVGLLALTWLTLIMPADRPRPATVATMDWRGAASLSVSLIALMSAVSDGASSGWLAEDTLSWLALAILMFLLFWRLEAGQRHPLIEVGQLRSRRIWPILATTILTLGSVFAVLNFTVILLSQNAEVGFGLAPPLSALLFLTPPSLIGVVAAPLAGWIANRYGWVRVLRLGLLCCLLTLTVIALAPLQQWSVCAAIAALGIFYNGLALTTVNGLGVFLSPRQAPAALPGLNGAAFGIGASLGISIVAPFVARGTPSGFSLALWISVGISLLALGASLCVPPIFAGDDLADQSA
jgi:predicted MFS family arabinose efflux permease